MSINFTSASSFSSHSSSLSGISSKNEKKTYPHIAFIGGGNMAEAILEGLVSYGFPPQKISVSEPVPTRTAYFCDRYSGLRVLEGDNPAAVTGAKSEKLRSGGEETGVAEVVVFAVKPQIMSLVTKELRDEIQKIQPLVVSIVAGIRTRDIARWLTTGVAKPPIKNKHGEVISNQDQDTTSTQSIPIIRCMPNTPALILEGAAGLYATLHVTDAQKALAEEIIGAIAKEYSWLQDESLIDAVTALSGSGPAYCFLMMEVMEQAAVDLGIPRDIASKLTIQTFVGASKMAQANTKTITLAELRRRVTSPNGTTEAALKHMEKENFSHVVSDAVKAADRRSKELAEQFGKD
ncbi:4581_t:CDS:2 [Ambispora gerdemannii]|uniref:Pyrroline-5-carboxylate reductase n=1 Tax=Ambispora gerdemannii TaxID=144530 RepID=A0A9N9B2N1_9GLOM|nr:4581_t:CDS:2 [Ambispora gerdemannii]